MEGNPANRLCSGDSRTPHYNVPASGCQDRLAVYTCFMPVADASQEDLIRKKAAYDGKRRETPVQFHIVPTNIFLSQSWNYPLAERSPFWN